MKNEMSNFIFTTVWLRRQESGEASFVACADHEQVSHFGLVAFEFFSLAFHYGQSGTAFYTCDQTAVRSDGTQKTERSSLDRSVSAGFLSSAAWG